MPLTTNIRRAGLAAFVLPALFFSFSGCSAPEAPHASSDLTGKVESLYQHSTLGIEKLGVIQVVDDKSSFSKRVHVTITAKTNIVRKDKKAPFEALKEGQQVEVWLKNQKSTFLNAQITALHINVLE